MLRSTPYTGQTETHQQQTNPTCSQVTSSRYVRYNQAEMLPHHGSSPLLSLTGALLKLLYFFTKLLLEPRRFLHAGHCLVALPSFTEDDRKRIEKFCPVPTVGTHHHCHTCQRQAFLKVSLGLVMPGQVIHWERDQSHNLPIRANRLVCLLTLPIPVALLDQGFDHILFVASYHCPTSFISSRFAWEGHLWGTFCQHNTDEDDPKKRKAGTWRSILECEA